MYHGICVGPVPDAPFAGRGKHVSAELFERQMAWLHRHARVLPMDEVVAALESGAVLPRGTVVVTLDDGYRNNFDVALPILERHATPAIVYVTTDFVGGHPLWVDRVDAAIEASRVTQLHVPAVPWAGHLSLPLGEGSHRLRAAHEVRARGKQLESAAREQFVREVTAQAGLDLETQDESCRAEDLRALTPVQLPELRRRGVDVGCHTVSHAILTRCGDEELQFELGEARRLLEAWTGGPVVHFAYPNGSPGDFDLRTETAVRAAGFRSSVTTKRGPVPPTRGAWALPRIPVNGGEGLHLFLCDIAGLRPAILQSLNFVRGHLTRGGRPGATTQPVAAGPSGS